MRKSVRNLRKFEPLDYLFLRIRQGVLAAVLLHPERRWRLRAINEYLGVSASSLQRELAGLVAAEVLLREKEGSEVLYRPNLACPFLSDLRGLLAKTVGLADVLRQTLEPSLANAEIAFIYGSVARAEEHSESDIDVLLLGSLTLADLALPLRDAERRLSRPVNPTVFTPAEFAARTVAGSHFLQTVLTAPKIFLKGTADDLARLAQSASGAGAPDQFAGTH